MQSIISLGAMVRDECANFKHGECLFTRDGRCPVLSGERCPISKSVLIGGDPSDGAQDYFGACVAPLANDRPEYVDAATEYLRICGERVAADVRRCECGERLSKCKQLCDTCRQNRRRSAWRSQKQNQRGDVLQKFAASAS